MKVSQAIELLQQLDGDTELLVAYQPHWPLQVTVADVRQPKYDPDCCEDPQCHRSDTCATCGTKSPKEYAYIVAGSSGALDTPYAPNELFGN
jgi:hypothetical protein